ncbi:hypothetical protein BASA81_007528 [Batrachochytrium salamandrivorans]|nr:hypothetical protein BASA81_007528 [Batrachochytrium salamandrivorans]
MVEFCAEYASGKRTTLAMRRAKVRGEWHVDPYATFLLAYESRTVSQAKPDRDPKPIAGQGKRSRQRQVVLPTPVVPQLVDKLGVPGVVLSLGNGFAYRCEAMRTALERVGDLLNNEGGFYLTPEHAMHITLATCQKFKVGGEEKLLDVEQTAHLLRTNPMLLQECRRGPITLVVESLHIPNNGNAVVVLFRDDANRIRDLRNALLPNGASYHVPEFIHSTVARVASLPSCTRQDLLQRLEGVVEGIEVEIDAMDLVMEEYLGYMVGFPQGVVAHWDLLPLVGEEQEETVEKEEGWSWLDGDRTVMVAVGLLALSAAILQL